MPVHKCPNGKWRIGHGKCIYPDKATAERAYKGYMAAEHMHPKKSNEEAHNKDGSVKIDQYG